MLFIPSLYKEKYSETNKNGTKQSKSNFCCLNTLNVANPIPEGNATNKHTGVIAKGIAIRELLR